MTFATLYHSASGASLEDFSCIGQRYDREAGLESGRLESWVVTVKGDEFSASYGIAGDFTRLSRAPSGTLFVAEAGGAVRVNRTPAARQKDDWKIHLLDGLISGVFAVDDDRTAYAWGERGSGHPVFRFEGTNFREIASPGFAINALHGVSDSQLVAAGDDGQAARFDGRIWTGVPTGTEEDLTAVHVESDQVVRLVGLGGSLLELQGGRFERVAKAPGPLFGVAGFNQQVWLGAGPLGLFRRTATGVECVKANIPARTLSAGSSLLITCDDEICGTRDGKAFGGKAEGLFAKLREGKPPLWETTT